MALVHSVLMAAIGGMRAMTPLAAVANAARDDLLPRDNGAPDWLSSRVTSAATGALALAEMAGDKMKGAPDRIALPGLLARCATGAMAAVALAPARQRNTAALLGAAAAIGLEAQFLAAVGLLASLAAAAQVDVEARAPGHRFGGDRCRGFRRLQRQRGEIEVGQDLAVHDWPPFEASSYTDAT